MERNGIASVVADLLRLLEKLDPESRRRVLQTAATFFEVPVSSQTGSVMTRPNLEQLNLDAGPVVPFSKREDISPKEFLLQKRPKTDLQRIACLAFYLANFRETPHFKTSDLTALNTEAAQPRFSNIAKTAFDAMRRGYLTGASKEKRQLSAYGEQFVLALPDQIAAMASMSHRSRRAKSATTGAPTKRLVKRVTAA